MTRKNGSRAIKNEHEDTSKMMCFVHWPKFFLNKKILCIMIEN